MGVFLSTAQSQLATVMSSYDATAIAAAPKPSEAAEGAGEDTTAFSFSDGAAVHEPIQQEVAAGDVAA
eukprot:SAG11_NODE_381_length_9941_cov_11.761885_2_plen_68_part_00